MQCSSTKMRIVPTFSELSLPELLQVHCLTELGQTTLKRLLWVLKENYPLLEYNPMIVQTAAISLLFFDEAQTYLLITNMIDESATKLDERKQINSAIMKDLRWNARLFFEVACDRSSAFKRITEKLKSLDFDYIHQFLVWTMHFFTNILAFPTVLRLYMIYLNEGIRVIYKMSYGIWVSLAEQVHKCQTKEDVEHLLSSCSIDQTLEATDRLFVTAYRLKIKKISKSFSELSTAILLPQIKNIYRPHTKEKSQILSYDQLEAIWEWIPSSFKITNPDLIYSTFHDGFSYSTLIERAGLYLDNPMLLIIKTTNSKVFGVFSEKMIETCHFDNYFGSEEIFLFTLEPSEELFIPTNKNTHFINCTREELSFGTGVEGPALLLNNYLKGQSNCNDTFTNKPLHQETDKHFDVMNLEMYALCS